VSLLLLMTPTEPLEEDQLTPTEQAPELEMRRKREARRIAAYVREGNLMRRRP
jgi:hypothetical protein